MTPAVASSGGIDQASRQCSRRKPARRNRPPDELTLTASGGPLPVVMSLHGKGGGSRGSLPVFERLRQSGQTFGAVLYVHPAETGRGLDDIKNEVQGILDLELRVTGWRGEPLEVNSIDSAPWQDGGSAIEACWAILDRLREGPFANASMNIGEIDGGDRIGSIAESARASVRIKFSPPQTWSALLREARSDISMLLAEYQQAGEPYAVELVPVGYRTNPGTADWNSPASVVLRDAIADVVGKAPAAYPNHYAGDIRYPIRLLGVPAYGIGSLAGGFYGPNEWVDVDDLVRLVAVVIATVSVLLNTTALGATTFSAAPKRDYPTGDMPDTADIEMGEEVVV